MMLISQVDLKRVLSNDPSKLAPLVAAGSFTTVIAAVVASVQLLLGAAPSTAAAAGGVVGSGSWVSALETGADAALSLLTLVAFSRAMEVLLMERDSVLTCVFGEEREDPCLSFPLVARCHGGGWLENLIKNWEAGAILRWDHVTASFQTRRPEALECNVSSVALDANSM